MNTCLTEHQIVAIRARYARGEKQVALARAFRVAQSHISNIVHDKARTEEARQCCDCGEPINLSRKRCEPCKRTYKFVYWQQWYASNGKARTSRRYRTEQGGFVIDKHTGAVHGPYTYNHARYLTSKWNKQEGEHHGR